jgi:hypothetical protein
LELLLELYDAATVGSIVGAAFMAGFIVCAYAGFAFSELKFFKRLMPQPPPPKPRTYRVTVEGDDGWPYRSYSLPVETVARMVRDLDRSPDNGK